MRNKVDTSPEALAEELLGRSYDDLDEEEQRALCRVASTEIELDPDEFDLVQVKFGDRAADAVARVGGSWGFIIVFSIVLVGWMLINGPLAKKFGIAMDQGDVRGKKIAEDAGNKIITLDEAETEKWKVLSQKVTTDWIEEMNGKGLDGTTLFNDAVALIDKYNQ